MLEEFVLLLGVLDNKKVIHMFPISLVDGQLY